MAGRTYPLLHSIPPSSLFVKADSSPSLSLARSPMAGDARSPISFGVLGCAAIARLAPSAALYAVAGRSIPPCSSNAIPPSLAGTPKAGDAGSPIRFGILGCATVARKLSRAISLAPSADLHAVASRSIDKARRFAESNGFPASAKTYGSYEELLDDPDVDVVYMPLPTSLHLDWAVAAARKGKHVLLEKPVALSVSELDRILEACESARVQFMDGTMWMHHPRTQRMWEFLSDERRFGQLKSIETSSFFAAEDHFLKNNIRVKPDLDALGALGDVGWYCIRAALWAADYKLPKLATALRGAIVNEAGVILSCGASLLWEDGKVGTFHCSFLSHTTMDITAVGVDGTLHVSDFIIPQEETRASFSAASGVKFTDLLTGWTEMPSEHVVENSVPQEVCMVEEFSGLVGGIKWEGLEPEKKWPVLSRKTQAVIDAVKASIERGYEPMEVVY